MKYKILIVKNRFKGKTKFEKGLEYFKKKTPIEIEVSEIKTDLDLTFENVSNATYKGVAVSDAVKDDLRKIIPDKTYNLIVFLFGNNAPGIRVSMADVVPLFPDTDFVEVIKTDDGGKVLNHEMFHSFFYKLHRRGIHLSDPMDSVVVDGKIEPYYNNNDLDAKKSNRTIALELLAPHWATIAHIQTTPMPTQPYKYFSQKEVDTFRLKDELWRLLDKARELAGTSFVLTSGLRTPEQNKAVGGVPNSAHLKGLACDLACVDNTKRSKMLYGLLTQGVPCFIEVARKHIHVDIDPSIHAMGQVMIEPNDD